MEANKKNKQPNTLIEKFVNGDFSIHLFSMDFRLQSLGSRLWKFVILIKKCQKKKKIYKRELP